MNPNWDYQCVIDTDADSDDVWDCIYHVYEDAFISMYWNNYRCIRILVSQLLSSQLSRLGYLPASAEQLRLRKIESEMVDEICAGTPYRLRLSHVKSTQSNLDVVPLLDAYGMIWPLFIVGSALSGQACVVAPAGPAIVSDGPDTELAAGTQSMPLVAHTPIRQLLWIVGRLKYIAKMTGVQQAELFAQALLGQSNIKFNIHT